MSFPLAKTIVKKSTNQELKQEPDYNQGDVEEALDSAVRLQEEMWLLRRRMRWLRMAMQTFCSAQVVAQIDQSLQRHEEQLAAKTNKRPEPEPELVKSEEEPEKKKQKRQKTGIQRPYNVLTSVVSIHNKSLTDTPEHIPHPEVMKKVSEIWKTLSSEQMKILQEMTEFLNSAPESRYSKEETLEKHALLFPPQATKKAKRVKTLSPEAAYLRCMKLKSELLHPDAELDNDAFVEKIHSKWLKLSVERQLEFEELADSINENVHMFSNDDLLEFVYAKKEPQQEAEQEQEQEQQ